MVLHGLALTVNQRLAVEVEHYEGAMDLRVVPPLRPIRISPVDLSHSAELIEGSHRSTRDWPESRHPTIGHAALVEPHHH